MSIINGKLHKRVRLTTSSSPAPQVCPLCGQGMQWITSILAKVKTGSASRWIEDKDEPEVVYDEDGSPHSAFAMKKVTFPLTMKLRICDRKECLKKAIDVYPNNPDTSRTTILPERGSRERRNYTADGPTIDPSWMTARGRRS